MCLGTKGGVGGTAAVRLSADGEGGCWGGWLNWSQVWKPISGIISDEACCAPIGGAFCYYPMSTTSIGRSLTCNFVHQYNNPTFLLTNS